MKKFDFDYTDNIKKNANTNANTNTIANENRNFRRPVRKTNEYRGYKVTNVTKQPTNVVQKKIYKTKQVSQEILKQPINDVNSQYIPSTSNLSQGEVMYRSSFHSQPLSINFHKPSKSSTNSSFSDDKSNSIGVKIISHHNNNIPIIGNSIYSGNMMTSVSCNNLTANGNADRFRYGDIDRINRNQVIQRIHPASSGRSNNHLINGFISRSKRGKNIMVPNKLNQDRYAMKIDFATNSVLLMVMDGHGEHGHVISEFVSIRFPDILFNDDQFSHNVTDSLHKSIIKIHQLVIKECSNMCNGSGTTLVCCVIRGNALYVANVGDSRLMIAKEIDSKLLSIQLTTEHKLDLPSEKSRLHLNDCVISETEVSGYKIHRLNKKNGKGPGLSMSRSIGDKIAHDLGVSYIPEIQTYFINKEDKYIILCSDGIFEFLKNEEIIDLLFSDDTIDDGIDTLLDESGKRWLSIANSIDDMTILITNLKN